MNSAYAAPLSLCRAVLLCECKLCEVDEEYECDVNVFDLVLLPPVPS